MSVEDYRKQYAPSAEKVVAEEAEDPRKRANADLFVDGIFHRMDISEYGPNAFVPTPQGIVDAYQEVAKTFGSIPERLFSLHEAYGAAKRRLLFQKELAAETIAIYPTINSISMRNMGNMFTLLTAIELALPPDQRPQRKAKDFSDLV